MNIELSERQKNVVAAGLTTLCGAIVVVAAVLFLVYAARFFAAFESVFLPLAVAAVLAMVLDPWYGWLRERMPVILALVAVFISVIVPLGFMVLFFGALIVTQLAELSDQVPIWWNKIVAWFQENRPEIERIYENSEIGQKLTESLKTPGGPLVAMAEHVASNIIAAGTSVISVVLSLLGWVIVPVYLAFFLMMPRLRPESLTPDHLPFLKEETAKDAVYLIQEFFRLVVVFFRGQIIVALIQGILFAIGFSLVGLQHGAVLGLSLGFLNIVPYLGSMLGLSICLPMAWFQVGGGPTLFILVILVFAAVQAIEGYYLTPKIMGDATGLSPLVIIVGIFFWGAALNGILGMILAIPLTAFVVVLWRLAREKYIGQLF